MTDSSKPPENKVSFSGKVRTEIGKVFYTPGRIVDEIIAEFKERLPKDRADSIRTILGDFTIREGLKRSAQRYLTYPSAIIAGVIKGIRKGRE